MSESAKEATKDHQNGVDGACKSHDPSECDPCIEEKSKGGRIWNKAAQRLKAKSGLSRNGLYYVGGLILTLILLLITVIILGALWPSTPHHHQFPVCNDAACLRASAQIQQYMNPAASRCEDVSKWACGNWLAHNSLPVDRSKWNLREQLRKQEAVRIRELITTLPLPINRGTVEWKLKHLYEACIDIDNVNSDRERPLLTIISELGGWHILRDWNLVDFDYKVTLNHLQVKYGVTPFFKIAVIPNPRSPGNSSIALMPAGLGLPDKSYYYLHHNNDIIKAYKQLIRDVVINLGAPKTGAETFGNNIFFYEQRIAEITPDSIDLLNPTQTYNPRIVSTLSDSAPNLPLQDILTSMFPSANIDDKTEVIVTHPEYFSSISQIVSSTDRITMNGYLIWTLVREHLSYLSSQYTAAMDVYNSELFGIKKSPQRWEFCTTLVQKFMPVAINAMLEKQNPITNATKILVYDIFTNLKKAVQQRLNKYDNKMPELYSHLERKISTLKLQIGLPEKTYINNTFIKNFYNKLIILKADLFESYKNGISFMKKLEEQRLIESDKEDYLISINDQDVTKTVYISSSNTIVVPRALVMAPFYEDRYPRSIIYGRLGVDIANSIVSSVLPYESAWTSHLKLLTSFHLAVNDSLKVVQHPTKCLTNFITQHNLTIEDKANLTSLNTYKFLSALNIAHDALQLSLKNEEHVHQPSLEIYEDSALFFLTQIQSLCSFTTRQQELYDAVVDFKLPDMSLIQAAWYQEKLMSISLNCRTPNTNQCSDIF